MQKPEGMQRYQTCEISEELYIPRVSEENI